MDWNLFKKLVLPEHFAVLIGHFDENFKKGKLSPGKPFISSRSLKLSLELFDFWLLSLVLPTWFSFCDQKLLTIDDVPELEVGVREAARLHSMNNGQGVFKCTCRSKCRTKACKCKKEDRTCNSRCHKNLSCDNHFIWMCFLGDNPFLWMCFLSIKYVVSWDAYWALIIQSLLARFVSSGDFVFGCLQYNLSFLSIFTEDNPKIHPFHRSTFSTTVLNLSLMCYCSVLNWG